MSTCKKLFDKHRCLRLVLFFWSSFMTLTFFICVLFLVQGFSSYEVRQGSGENLFMLKNVVAMTPGNRTFAIGIKRTQSMVRYDRTSQ